MTFKLIFFVALAALALLLLVRASREWIVEQLKAASDVLIISLLRFTSQFGRELTDDGRAEQRMWREQRLRNLRALASRSRQRWDGKSKE